MKLKIKGKMENCENGAIGKKRQKNVPKGPKEKLTKPGHHMYVDLTHQNILALEDQNIGV